MIDNGTVRAVQHQTEADAREDICIGATSVATMQAKSIPLLNTTIMVPCPIVDLEKRASVLTLDDWSAIRWMHFRDGKSIRWISREFAISRKTVTKYLAEPEPPKYKLQHPRAKPIADQWRKLVQEIVAADETAPRKQKHTARRIYDRLVEDNGYVGSERTIRQMVAQIKNKPAAGASVPLSFEPGKDGQVDFGESYADIAGKRVKLHGFEMRLSYSRKTFLQFFPSTDKEAFLEGHVRAFAFFGGVIERLSYDNLGAGVANVGKGKERTLTKEFKGLKGYYNFETNFCKPGIDGAHEKGGVESGIGFSRRNWMVPVPKFETLEQLNAHILQKCLDDEARQVDGQAQTIGQAWQIERAKLLPLPTRPFDPAVNYGGLVDSYCTVSLKDSHYSVPAEYVGRGLTIRAYWNRVQITDGIKLITEHPRTYNKDEYVLLPEHYLGLLERRPHAVPYARPLLQHTWPDGYWELYRRMVADLGPGPGGKDFIRILRAHMKYGSTMVAKAIKDSLQVGGSNADFIIAMVDRARLAETEPEVTEIDSYPQLAQIKVSMYPPPEHYGTLLAAQGGYSHDD
jgi:transposase